MDLKLRWTTLLFILILPVSCDPHLSEQDVALLTEEENPKCFTTNLKDLTCFWEVPEGKTYEFLYMIDEDDERRCDVRKQRTEDGKILQVCFFPPDDVYMFAETVLRVVETQTDTTIYNRTIYIEEKILLDPPSSPSLEYTGEVGELLVGWKITKKSTLETFPHSLQYEIRYSSDSLPGKVTLVKSHKSEHRLISLVPGEMCTIQIRLMPKGSMKGFWSAWSPSVTAMVPQPADDVDFQCHTPDLHQIQCRWNEGRYGSGIYSLHYRQTNRSDWEICDRSNASGIQCVLYGKESTVLEVFLEAELESVNRTFYSGMFRMNNSIKTEAPDGLKEESDAGRHCLSWNSPLPLISQHLIYQIRYQLQGESEWKLYIVPSPRTNTCLDVQVGSQYSIQVKAMPNGSLYSGHWSAWSKSLVVQLPSNTVLLDSPSPPSLEYTGEVGELLVRWNITKNSTHETFAHALQYEIRYSSDSSPGTVTLVKSSKWEHRLISLVPGEMCTIQIRLMPKGSLKGFWSDWSPSVTAMVPQPADDVDFQCHTPDLHQIQCRWNEGRYGSGVYSLHYRQTNRSDWEICDRTNASGIQCVLYGEESTMLEFFLEAELESVNRTFYSGMFRMNNSIKTEAPDGLKEESDAGRHCLSWNSPLPLISQHLIYQIRYQLQGESEWKLYIVPSPRTNTCLDVQVGSQYSIQVKAMPNGSLYSGHWSAWSKNLVVQLPSNTGLQFIALIPFSLLIISVILFSFLSRYASKIKQFLWPPVPNLNEVLEGFLKDINAQHWEPNFSIKLCDEDIPSSVVEIMSDGDAQVGRKPSNCFHFPQHGYISGNGNGEYATEGLELNREYVTLNTGEVLPCLTGNDYVYKVNSSSAQTGDKLCCQCSSFCYISFSTPTTNILNHSYVQAGDDEASIPMLHYTNLEDTSAKLRHNEE